MHSYEPNIPHTLDHKALLYLNNNKYGISLIVNHSFLTILQEILHVSQEHTRNSTMKHLVY